MFAIQPNVKASNMPKVIMLIGLPGVGKSTWLAQQSIDWNNSVLVSTDNIIDQRAQVQGKTYSQVFKQEIQSAARLMNSILQRAIADNKDVIWDQTNISAQARKGKLIQFPADYEKIGVFFVTPADEEHQRRLNSRPGKIIPHAVIQNMKAQLQQPTEAEGFDQIIHVG